MFVQLFKDSLNEYTYAAELAGLKWDIANTKYGIIVSYKVAVFFVAKLNPFSMFQISVGGYNDKQHIFLNKVMEKLTSFKVDPKRFAIYKENVRKYYVIIRIIE